MESTSRPCSRRLTVSIVAAVQIEVGDDRTGAENARRQLNGIFEQTLVIRDAQDDVCSLHGMSQLQCLFQHASTGFVGVETMCAAPGEGREPLSGRV